MIPFSELPGQIKKLNYTHALITDEYGQKIYRVDDEIEPEGLIKRLQEAEYFLRNWNALTFRIDHAGGAKAGFKSGVVWKVKMKDGENPTHTRGPAIQSPAAQMMETIQLITAMKTVFGEKNDSGITKEYLEMREKLLKQEYEHKLAEMSNAGTKMWNEYGPLAPIALSAMGKTNDEIKEMLALSHLAMSRPQINGTPSAVASSSSAPAITKDYLDKVKGMDQDAKNVEINKEWDELAKKASAEQVLLLLKTLNNKPALIDKAVTLANSGML